MMTYDDALERLIKAQRLGNEIAFQALRHELAKPGRGYALSDQDHRIMADLNERLGQ